MTIVALALLVAAPAAAQPAQITIAQPAEATTMDPGRSTGNPQSTLLDADGSLWRLLHPNGFGGKYWMGSQPGQRFHDVMEEARYSLDPKKRKALYTQATQVIHEEKPSLELFQEVIVYGTSRRVSFKVRPDYRLIVSEMTVTR
jgi:ABC-type transport system substrate-binding protein